MPNPHRGEIEAVLDGKPYRLCLTLGALAELEQAFGDTDMLALAERFQSGRLAARDAQRVIGAGLRGGGTDIADEAVARLRADGGAAGYVDIVARLLNAIFAGATTPPPTQSPTGGPAPSPSTQSAPCAPSPAQPALGESSAEGRVPPAPFPGTT